MKTIADNRQSKKWISFGTLVLGAGTIYKLGCLKDAFYVPMQEFMGLTHTDRYSHECGRTDFHFRLSDLHLSHGPGV